jgi:hypothetical protein
LTFIITSLTNNKQRSSVWEVKKIGCLAGELYKGLGAFLMYKAWDLSGWIRLFYKIFVD